jgi:hypothetical protein
MNNLRKSFFLDIGFFGKVCVVIVVLLAIYSGFYLTQSPSSLELIYIQLSFTLVLTLIIAGVSRVSNNQKVETFDSVLINLLLGGILIPIALALIHTNYVFSQAVISSSPQTQAWLVLVFVALMVYLSFYFSIFAPFLFKKKPANIFWLEILAKSGTSNVAGRSCRWGDWFQLPWFGKIFFKLAEDSAFQETDFNNIEVRQLVKVQIEEGKLTKDSIQSVTTRSGIVIYEA